ncbi:MAG: PHP domain-containing protein [Myxococcota bacterium]
MVGWALATVLVGVVHVHHAPSHDSEAPFEAVVAAAHEARLDFVVLTEHSDRKRDGPLPAAERAGLYTAPDGHRLRVLVGAEFATRSGHLLGLQIPRAYASEDVSARALIERIHRDGGFAVVAHPESHGGWHDWEAPFDGVEIENMASDFARQLGPLLPLRLLRYWLNRDAALDRMLRRPTRELERYEALLQGGREVVALAGADAHRNVRVLGVQLDPYRLSFTSVQMRCPEGPLTADSIWAALRQGRCAVHWRIRDGRRGAARRVVFPSGHTELWLGGDDEILEVQNPRAREPGPAAPGAAP